MNEEVRIKVLGRTQYVTFSNELLLSKDLTLGEKGFLVHILSLPDDYILYKSNLYKEFAGDTTGFVNRTFKSLQVKGYIESIRQKNEKGRYTGWKHVVYDIPKDNKS